MPSWETNCIEDWETKVNAIVEETIKENMAVISGIPSWVQMYFEKLQEKVVKGEENVLWKGKPLYFAKTSGTTSGAKYIPLTKESMPFHIQAARNAILSYIHETGKADFVSGKMIFLQGSPILEEKNGIKLGRLSGIVAHFVPKYLQKNRLPIVTGKQNRLFQFRE